MRTSLLRTSLVFVATLALAACSSSAASPSAPSAAAPSAAAPSAAAPSAAAPSAAAPSAAKTLKVALICFNQQALFFNQLNDGAKQEAAKDGVELTIFNPNNDPAAQNTAIEGYITQGYQAIIVDAIDVEGIKPALKAARDAGLVVIAVDQVLSNNPSVNVQVGVDNQAAGAQLGDFFNTWAKTNLTGPVEIGVVGALQSSIQIIRQKGFVDTVTPTGAKIVQVVDGRNDPTKALPAAETLITAQPSMNVIYGTGEPALTGAVGAARSQNGTKRLKIFGWDLNKQVIAGIDDGFVIAVVQQDPVNEGVQSVKSAVALLQGTQVDSNITVPVTIVTKDNVDQFRAQFK